MARISIEGYSVHGLLHEGLIDVFGFLESLRHRYRVDGAGLWNGLLASLDADYLAKVRWALTERELAVPCIHFDGCSVWAEDPQQRTHQRELALAAIQAAHALGAGAVRIDWGIVVPTLTDEQFDHLVASYRDYCVRADELGMDLGPENHFGASLDPELQLQVLRAVDHPRYKVLLHLGRWNRLLEQGDALLAPHTMHTHIATDLLVEHEAHVCRSIKQLEHAGYRGYWGVESGTGRNEYAQLEWQVGAVRRILAFGADDEMPVHGGTDHNPLLVEGADGR